MIGTTGCHRSAKRAPGLPSPRCQRNRNVVRLAYARFTGAGMQRLRDYLRFLSWSSGLGYIALWAMTLWTLDQGAAVFARAGCRAGDTMALFYWVCSAGNPMSIVASLSNTALTLTLWGPVYLAAVTVDSDALKIALPIVATHAFGLPAAILVLARVMVALLHGLKARVHGTATRSTEKATVLNLTEDMLAARAPRRFKTVKPRTTFGLRGARSAS
jgi:hypothetical protein